MKILITGGGTREPIDGVRFITNFSTGSTAARIIDEFVSRGADVTALMGTGSVRPAERCDLHEFGSFADLDEKIRKILSQDSFDGVIHLAAVGDYSIASLEAGGKPIPTSGKIDSTRELTLHLKPNHKIIERITNYSRNKNVLLIGFKLTNAPDVAERGRAVRKLAGSPGIRFIVHNDLTELQAGRPVYTLFEIQSGEPREVRRFGSVAALAAGLRETMMKG